MQKMLRLTFAIALLTSAVSFAADQARAIPLTAPAPDAAAANSNFIVPVGYVCGRGGCAPVFTKRVTHPPIGFVKRAVPLTVPKTTAALQPVNASK